MKGNIEKFLLKSLDEYKGHMTKNGARGGMPYLDINFRFGDLITLFGRPCNGRTTFLVSLLNDVSVNNKVPVAYFPSDHREKDFVGRLVAAVSDVSYMKIAQGERLSEEEWGRYNKAIEKISKSPIYIESPDHRTIESILPRIKNLADDGVRVVVISDFQGIETERSFSDCRYAYSHNARLLKFIASELNIAIIIMSSTNWFLEEREGVMGKMPILADLQEIGDLDLHSDTVIGIFSPRAYEVHYDVRGRKLDNILVVNVLKANGVYSGKKIYAKIGKDSLAIDGVDETIRSIF